MNKSVCTGQFIPVQSKKSKLSTHFFNANEKVRCQHVSLKASPATQKVKDLDLMVNSGNPQNKSRSPKGLPEIRSYVLETPTLSLNLRER